VASEREEGRMAFFLEEVDLEKADNKLAKGFSSHY
jgi:hypothetical protein